MLIVLFYMTMLAIMAELYYRAQELVWHHCSVNWQIRIWVKQRRNGGTSFAVTIAR